MTLQEYLVKLGWSVDEPSFKKFVGAISSTTAKTAELGSTVLETAAAIELMVSRVARKYETLYYASQRTGQSVKYIQSTQFAFKAIGLSADDANASIENMAATIRTQPWLKAIFGGASTPQAVADKLGKSGLPYFLQTRFAEMIGMDEKTLLHLQKFSAVEASASANMARRQKEAGINPDQLAEKTAGFGRELNRLESDLEIFGDRMAINFLDPVSKGIKLVDESVQWLNRLDSATKGWVGTLGTLAGTAGGLLVLEKILRRILGLGGKTATGGALGFVGRGLKTGIGGGGLVAALAGVLGLIKQNDPETKAGLRNALGPALYELGLSKSPDLSDDGSRPDVGTAKAAGGAGRGKERLEQTIDALVKAGYPRASAEGIAAGLYSESKLNEKSVNPTSGAEGIGQWLGDRKTKFRQKYNHDLSEATFEEQLQYVMDELQSGDPQSKEAGSKLRKGGMGSRDAAGTFIHLFERPGAAGEASDMSRAGPIADALSNLTTQNNNAPTTNNITLHSKVDVHPPAGADVMSTAKAYGDAHDGANDSLVRNLVGAMR